MANAYQFYEFRIRPNMVEALERYVETGHPVGDFLTAVITNDLMRACGYADDDNKRNIPAFCGWLYNVAPMNCHGSKEKMKAWQEIGGQQGLERQRRREYCDKHDVKRDASGSCPACEVEYVEEDAS